jgi:GTPase SAR1 family protein
VTKPDSFNHLQTWLADARTLSRPDITIISVGNKLDLKSGSNFETVNLTDASRFAQENDIQIVEASALTGENVEEVFT